MKRHKKFNFNDILLSAFWRLSAFAVKKDSSEWAQS